MRSLPQNDEDLGFGEGKADKMIGFGRIVIRKKKLCANHRLFVLMMDLLRVKTEGAASCLWIN